MRFFFIVIARQMDDKLEKSGREKELKKARDQKRMINHKKIQKIQWLIIVDRGLVAYENRDCMFLIKILLVCVFFFFFENYFCFVVFIVESLKFFYTYVNVKFNLMQI